MLVITFRSYVAALYPMLAPCETSIGVLMDNDLGAWWFNLFLLESKLPYIIACSEILGLRLEGWIMFNVICDFSASFSHRCIGNIF